MAYAITADISRMLVAGQKQVFTKNFESFPLEYPTFTTPKSAEKLTESYDSMGNLKAAEEKQEGSDIKYGKITQAYQTLITNKTWANGFEVTLEAIKYDLYKVLKGAAAKELARTMRELEETNAIYWIDNIDSVNLADGVPCASNSKPLIDSALLNDTLATGGSIADPDVHKATINMFYDFKNHAGGPMKSKATNGLTHYHNQMTVEEVYSSINKAGEMSNTKNRLPMLKWSYSTYMSSQDAFLMWDNRFEHILMQTYMGAEFANDTDGIYTKNQYYNAVAMYQTGCLPNIGIVYNAGA